MAKPLKGYPKEVKSLGDHIRARRLTLGLLQEDAAHFLKVSTDTVIGWETGRSEPKMYHYPEIIQFLGYFPFAIDLSTLALRIKHYRYRKGLSHRKMGKLLDKDASTVASWEKEESRPHPETLAKLEKLLSEFT